MPVFRDVDRHRVEKKTFGKFYEGKKKIRGPGDDRDSNSSGITVTETLKKRKFSICAR